MKFKSHIYFKCRQATKDPGITGQAQFESTNATTPSAHSHTLNRAVINRCLTENRKGKQALVIHRHTQEEMIVEEPTTAVKEEPEKTIHTPKVSCKMSCDKESKFKAIPIQS